MTHTLRPRAASVSFKDSESMTEQHHKEEVNIHNIVRRHRETGLVSHLAKYQGQYMDMTDAPDFYAAQSIIAEANSMFETVPATIRSDFDNDAGKFLAFMQNPENRERIEEYGLDSSHLPEVAPQQEPAARMPASGSQSPPEQRSEEQQEMFTPQEMSVIERYNASQRVSDE